VDGGKKKQLAFGYNSKDADTDYRNISDEMNEIEI
jgi:hypothetical protein